MVRKITNESKSLRESKPELVKTTVNTARKLFDNGDTVYLLPNKVKLGNAWIMPFAVSQDTAEGHSFDNIINAYSYYNCNKEVGNGISYYKEV